MGEVFVGEYERGTNYANSREGICLFVIVCVIRARRKVSLHNSFGILDEVDDIVYLVTHRYLVFNLL